MTERTRRFGWKAAVGLVTVVALVWLVVAQRDDALLVPETALLARGGKQYVYVAQDGKAVETEVEIATPRNGEVEVRQGLRAGQSVVVSGLQALANGSAIEVASKSP